MFRHGWTVVSCVPVKYSDKIVFLDSPQTKWTTVQVKIVNINEHNNTQPCEIDAIKIIGNGSTECAAGKYKTQKRQENTCTTQSTKERHENIFPTAHHS